MWHIVNGKIVVGDEATLSKAIHVHRACIDWYVFSAFFKNNLLLSYNHNLDVSIAHACIYKRLPSNILL